MSLIRPRTDQAASRPTSASSPAPSAPRATRIARPGWRDPRVIAGLLLVAVSVLAGARLMATADDTVPVWSVRRAVAAGATLNEADLVRRSVRLDDASAAAYLAGDRPAPLGRPVLRALGPGELLPRSVLRADSGPAEIAVPLSVARESVPAGVRPGAVVDVWVVPAADGPAPAEPPTAARALAGVRVVEAPRGGDTLAPQATRAVVVAVGTEEDLSRVLAAMAQGRVVLTLREPA